jgi:hypothetical protein
MAAVADHQAAVAAVPPGRERRDIGAHLSLQRLGEHPPRAFPHNLIDQRRRAILLPALVARAVARD